MWCITELGFVCRRNAGSLLWRGLEEVRCGCDIHEHSEPREVILEAFLFNMSWLLLLMSVNECDGVGTLSMSSAWGHRYTGQ